MNRGQLPPRLDDAFELAVGTGAYEWYPDEDRLVWSAGLLQIYGLAEPPAGEQGFIHLVHPDDRVRVEGETNCFLDRGATAYSHTFRIVRPDGALRIVVDRGVIERDPDGRVHRIRGMNVDLTEMQSAMPAGGPAATARPAAGGAAELESLYAEAPLGLAFLDREMRVVRINRALAEINGFTPEAHLGRTVWDLVPDLRESAEPALLHVLESGEPLRNVRIRGKTHAQPGVLREWREHFYPLRGADGRVQGIGVVCEEITDRVAVYNALAESERRFKLALSGSPITVFEHDADLRYGWLFNSKLGYSDTFALGKTDHDIMDPAVANVLSAFKRRVLESGEPARKELAAAAPGAPLQYYDLLVHPSRDEKGNVTGLICVSTDITEKKRAEEALRAAHDTFRQLVEGSPFGVYAVDADFRLVQVSEGAQKVFETVRPLLGRDFAQVLRILWPEPFASETIERFRHTIATGEPYHAPNTVMTRTDIGKTEAYDWKIERITMPDGRQGAVCHFYDLTEKQAHQEKIEALMREMNHRAKNMLALVDAVAFQTASVGPTDFLERFRARIRALAACQDLLVQKDADWADLAALVKSQLMHFKDLVDRRIILGGPPVNVSANAAQTLGMALHELATNAAKYGALSNDRGSVTVSWRVEQAPDGPQFAMSWIEADGPPVAKPRRRGFGHRVAETMVQTAVAGSVTLDYAWTGVRWTLRCKLSSISEAAPAPTAAPPQSPVTASNAILIVEDNTLLAFDLAETLRRAGYDIIGPAASVATALDLLEKNTLVLAVLDINLGLETSEPVAHRLRELAIPFLTISGYSRAQQPAVFHDRPFLSKPVDMRLIVQEVERAKTGH